MENKQPLISVIVPVYNAEKYLFECVESIAGQSYSNLEIILIDDGSKDSSGELCDSYALKDERIKTIHKENGGVSSARNKGLDIATGEYVMFVDSDDKIVSDSVSILFKAIDERDFDIACGGTVETDNDAYFEGNICEWIENESVVQSLRDHPYTFSSCGKLYRKSLVGETRFLTDIRINEDTMFLFEILCKEPKVVNIKDRLYYYRQNFDSASNSIYSEKFEDILIVSDRKHRIVNERFPDLLYLADNMMLKARMNLLQILCLRTKGEKRQLERELIRYVKRNSKSYISITAHHDRWFKIVRYNLYYVYKFIYRILRTKR